MSVLVKLAKAEVAISNLSLEVAKETESKELRDEYYQLLQKAAGALNEIRATAEMVDWLKDSKIWRSQV